MIRLLKQKIEQEKQEQDKFQDLQEDDDEDLQGVPCTEFDDDDNDDEREKQIQQYINNGTLFVDNNDNNVMIHVSIPLPNKFQKLLERAEQRFVQFSSSC